MVQATYQNIKVICILQHTIDTWIDWLRRSRDHPKAHFLLFLDSVKSERGLMRIVPERLDYLWFLGYGWMGV